MLLVEKDENRFHVPVIMVMNFILLLTGTRKSLYMTILMVGISRNIMELLNITMILMITILKLKFPGISKFGRPVNYKMKTICIQSKS